MGKGKRESFKQTLKLSLTSQWVSEKPQLNELHPV